MKLEEAVRQTEALLKSKDIDEAAFKALCLCSHAAGLHNRDYYTHRDAQVDKTALEALTARLLTGEPLQYLLGRWDFYDSEFCVGEGVLIPRPETEELVSLALACLKTIEAPVVYDLCAGSGCIGVSIAKKLQNAGVYCIEKSPQAFAYLKRNAEGIGNLTLIQGDIGDDYALPPADVIVSNPPYIPSGELDALQPEVRYEPRLALDGGADGLEFYRLICARWTPYLKPTGRLLLEIGSEQGEAVARILRPYRNVRIIKDIYGNDRMVTADKG